MAAQPKSSPLPGVVIGVVVVAAAIFALTRSSSAPTPSPTSAPSAVATPPNEEPPPGEPNVAPNELPPGHPSIGAGGAGVGGMPPAAQESAVIVWTVPPTWQSVPNPSTMRLATYEIPHVQGDAENPQVSVIRAGGDTESNITRWIGQFDEAARKGAQRTERTVSGFKISILSIEGTYSGGMGMGMGGAAAPEEGWALLGAIVETPGGSYFFKTTGPKKSVAAARSAFDALVGSIKPAPTQ